MQRVRVRPALLVRLAKLTLNELKRTEQAVEFLEAALNADEGYIPALTLQEIPLCVPGLGANTCSFRATGGDRGPTRPTG